MSDDRAADFLRDLNWPWPWPLKFPKPKLSLAGKRLTVKQSAHLEHVKRLERIRRRAMKAVA